MLMNTYKQPISEVICPVSGGCNILLYGNKITTITTGLNLLVVTVRMKPAMQVQLKLNVLMTWETEMTCKAMQKIY